MSAATISKTDAELAYYLRNMAAGESRAHRADAMREAAKRLDSTATRNALASDRQLVLDSIRTDVEEVEHVHVLGEHVPGVCAACSSSVLRDPDIPIDWPCGPARTAQWLRRIVLDRQ